MLLLVILALKLFLSISEGLIVVVLRIAGHVRLNVSFTSKRAGRFVGVLGAVGHAHLVIDSVKILENISTISFKRVPTYPAHYFPLAVRLWGQDSSKGTDIVVNSFIVGIVFNWMHSVLAVFIGRLVHRVSE